MGELWPKATPCSCRRPVICLSQRFSGSPVGPFPAQTLDAPRGRGPPLMPMCPLQRPASSALCGPPGPSPPPGPLLSGEHQSLGTPPGSSSAALWLGFPELLRRDSLFQVLATPPRGFHTLLYMRSPLARSLMSLLSGHTSPDTFLPGTPPSRPAYPVPPRSYCACLCSLYWGAPDSRGGGCMGYGGSAEGGHLPRQHGHLGHSPALGYQVSRQPFPGHHRSGQGSSD